MLFVRAGLTDNHQRATMKKMAAGKFKTHCLSVMAGEFRITGDVESPVVPIEAWEVMRK